MRKRNKRVLVRKHPSLSQKSNHAANIGKHDNTKVAYLKHNITPGHALYSNQNHNRNIDKVEMQQKLNKKINYISKHQTKNSI